MSPDVALASLDAKLASVGVTITLQRLTAGPGGVQIPFSVDCKAFVRGYRPEELVGGISQQDSFVVLSPSEISARGWPGAATKPTTLDPRVPVKNDKIVIDGRSRNIEAAVGISIGDTLVRIELQVKG
jgi:hypothetical protein